MSRDKILVITTKKEGIIIVYQRDDGKIIQYNVTTNNFFKFDSWADWLTFVSQRKSSIVSLHITDFLTKNNIVDLKEIFDINLSIENKANIKNYLNPKVDKFFLENYPVLIEVEEIKPLSLNWKTAPIIDNEPTLKYIDKFIPIGVHSDTGTTVYGKLLIYSQYILQEQKFTNDDIGFVDDDYIESDFVRWYESLRIKDVILGIHYTKEEFYSYSNKKVQEVKTVLLKNPVIVDEEIKKFPYWEEF